MTRPSLFGQERPGEASTPAAPTAGVRRPRPLRRSGPGLLALALVLLLAATAARGDVFGEPVGKKFHHDGCPLLAAAKAKSKAIVAFDSEAEAAAKGYYPCPECFPPVASEMHSPLLQRKLSRTVTRGQPYLGDREKRVYHYPWCSLVQVLPPAKTERFADVRAAARAGYQACPVCNPPQPPKAVDLAESAAAETKPAAKPTVKPPPPRSPRPGVPQPGAAPDRPEAPAQDQEP